MAQYILYGIGMAIGVALWPLVLPLLVLVVIASAITQAGQPERSLRSRDNALPRMHDQYRRDPQP